MRLRTQLFLFDDNDDDTELGPREPRQGRRCSSRGRCCATAAAAAGTTGCACSGATPSRTSSTSSPRSTGVALQGDRAFLTLAAIGDERDSLTDPTRGVFWTATTELARTALGSDVDYVRLYGQFFAYVPLGRLVWAQGVRLGNVPGDDPLLLLENRFRAGGPTTVRGFEQNGLGPLTVEGDSLGGQAVVVLNQELRFPIWKDLKGGVFWDAGNVVAALGPVPLDATCGRASAADCATCSRSARSASSTPGSSAARKASPRAASSSASATRSSLIPRSFGSRALSFRGASAASGDEESAGAGAGAETADSSGPVQPESLGMTGTTPCHSEEPRCRPCHSEELRPRALSFRGASAPALSFRGASAASGDEESAGAGAGAWDFSRIPRDPSADEPLVEGLQEPRRREAALQAGEEGLDRGERHARDDSAAQPRGVAVVIVSRPCAWGPVSRRRRSQEKRRPAKPSTENIHIPGV